MFLLFLNSCIKNPGKDILKNNSIEGVWELMSYQPQDDTTFIKMEGVIIKKIYTESEWMSSAFKIVNSLVIYVAGGTFQLKNGILSEKVRYRLKHDPNIGKINTFNIEIEDDTLYQSGILNPGTPDEYKIEEYWIRVPKE